MPCSGARVQPGGPHAVAARRPERAGRGDRPGWPGTRDYQRAGQRRLDIDAQRAHTDQAARLAELGEAFVKVATSWRREQDQRGGAVRGGYTGPAYWPRLASERGRVASRLTFELDRFGRGVGGGCLGSVDLQVQPPQLGIEIGARDARVVGTENAAAHHRCEYSPSDEPAGSPPAKRRPGPHRQLAARSPNAPPGLTAKSRQSLARCRVLLRIHLQRVMRRRAGRPTRC